jgi:hypothetical protein
MSSSSSETLTGRSGSVATSRAGARGHRGAPDRREPAVRWRQSFDLAPGRSTPLADRGARHLNYSIAEMLLPAVRDLLATAERPLRALVLGCEEGYLAHCLLRWGVARVVAIESDPASAERAAWLQELAVIDPAELEVAHAHDLTGVDLGDEHFDLAVADGRPGRLGDSAAALELLAARASLCALIAPDRLPAATALRAAGFGKPTLAEPAADAERRLIAFELNLMIARPEPAGPPEPGE